MMFILKVRVIRTQTVAKIVLHCSNVGSDCKYNITYQFGQCSAEGQHRDGVKRIANRCQFRSKGDLLTLLPKVCSADFCLSVCRLAS
jgi:hypothetical protein